MNRNATSAGARLSAISKEKRELLKLLLEEKFRRQQEIRPCPRGDGAVAVRLPASWAQQRLWFIDELEGGSPGYQVLVAVRLRGALDQQSVQKALDAIVQRHEVLRTVFVRSEGELLQEIASHGRFALKVMDLSGYEEAEREVQVRLQKTEEVRGKFDLGAGPLIRGRLLRVHSKEHVLLVTMHHIIADNWSKKVLIREFAELYRAYREGRGDPLQSLPVQYADYAQWQREWLQGEILEKQLGYWRARLEGAPPQLDLPTDRPRPALQSYRGENVNIVLDAQLSAKLKSLAQRHETTLFMVLYAGWAILLSRLSGQEDVVIGTPIANRQRRELEGLIGLFANTLVLRARVQGDLRLEEFLEQIKETTLGAYEHQDAPFEQVVEALQPQRSLSRNPLFQIMFALQNTPKGELRLPGLVVTSEGRVDEYAIFDLMLPLEERGDEIVGSVNYAADLFDRETVERWMERFTVLLRAMTADAKSRIGDLPILPKRELHQVIHSFNSTQRLYPEERLIHELFEEQVRRTPDAAAAIYEQQSLTYAELNGRANQVAHYLREQGVQIGEYIPIVMQRGLPMLIAQLAVLKSGGVYVPVDPNLPPERQAFLVRDCGARRVLAEYDTYAAFERESLQWVDCSADAFIELPTDNVTLQVGATSAAYVMYTSGSTGVPKGVIVPHRAVNRLAINNGYARIEPTDCIAHWSNPAFDASTFEIWGALLNGASVLIVPQSVVLESKRFAELLSERRVTILWLTIGLFSQYTETLSAVFEHLRYLITGGDVVDSGAIRRVHRNNPPQHMLNGYGPTECTTFTTTYLVDATDEDAASIPIGRPISNTQTYILDSYLQPVPIGVTGEIYIGGAGVALGYLNRPRLTAERFIANPFSTNTKARLYKTGDLGRWRPDGNIDFLGRNDQQVKIRGFRVELGEIEAQLARHSQVQDAMAIVREDVPGEKRLVAYISQRGQSAPTVESLRAHLKMELPEYMIPSAFVILENFPLTPNGKVARHALPAPGSRAYVNREYEAPRGEVEANLARIWQELLQVERVGRQDNFFDLGGHSLLVLKALFRINQSCGGDLTVRDVYRSATLRELATRICGGTIEDDLVDLPSEAALDDEITAKAEPHRAPAKAIMLTGGTGFVGRFLLTQLLQDTDAHIYCLVRASSPHQALFRLKSTLEKWDLWRAEFESRIVAIPGDLRLPRLGIDDLTYQVLSQTIDSIYHCATSMNHLETYAMAKAANVESARELLKLATSQKTKLINYISSLSIFSSSAPGTTRVVDESSPIEQETHPASSGYAASKWVGEKIFMTAGGRGLPCNIFRLGLVWADMRGGRYDELQREYRVFKSCLQSGRGIENYRYEMAPTPVDYVARAVVFLANRHPDGRGIFHISSSNQMIEGVFERCNKILGTSLELMPLYRWIGEMKRIHHEGQSLPIIPLIEFAFSMDEESFYAHRRRTRSATLRYDCTQTHRELEQAGIVTPVLTDDMLRKLVKGMYARDAELRKFIDRSDFVPDLLSSLELD